ncbi:type IV secretion system protein VirB3 [Paracoccus liaowanqingii]|uniref:Type IV secretion system protein VirB3 n=1 Tax=Paracoccus liaowanqingii TaxID=2560053 RepID=A0A4Z1CSQ9_9RHOB|nr:VirB3 family type IV secretion system protein [Paracoccus liaowanqingii]TGN68312.1 type IV secretion system protein VirB3 [Paracoccus liaowanqingii]
MVKRSPLFLGLIRPARVMGLPMFYFVIWSMGSVLAFVWVQSFWTLTFTALTYPAFWLAAEWDPYFFDVVTVVSKKTRRTTNREQWGADSYEP